MLKAQTAKVEGEDKGARVVEGERRPVQWCVGDGGVERRAEMVKSVQWYCAEMVH